MAIIGGLLQGSCSGGNRRVSVLEQGDPVIVEAPDFFKGKKIGIYLEKCKDHEDSYLCELLDKNVTTRRVCVNASKRGDSLRLISDLE